MKLKITLLQFFIIIFSNAQIVLQENNTPHSSTYENIRMYNNSGISIPIEAENQIYDYSTLPNPTGNLTVNFNPATREGFDSFTRYFLGDAFLGDIALESEYYSKKDATGIMEVGSYKLPQNINLESITGNNLDFLNFPGGSNIFPIPFYTVMFPTSFGMSWSSDTHFQTDFLLTVTAFGLENTPGSQNQVATNTSEVVGWGELILPTPNGPSIPYNTLLIKNQEVIVSNYFINDSPAPASLLEAFGVSQGETLTQNVYYFYAEEFEVPIFTIVMSEDLSTVNFSYYDSTFLQTLGVNDVSFSKNSVIAYPNPVKVGSIVYFNQIKTVEETELFIYSTIGQLIYKTSLLNSESETLSWSIPLDFQKGLYRYSLHTKNSNQLYSGKLIIQ